MGLVGFLASFELVGGEIQIIVFGALVALGIRPSDGLRKSSRFDFEHRGKALVNARAIIHVGIAFILLGVVAFTYQGGGGTSGEQNVDFGIIRAGVDAIKTMLISPLLGAIGLVSGIVLVAVGLKIST